MRGTIEQESSIAQERDEEEGRTLLVLYGRKTRYQMAPPMTRTIFWFWTPEPPDVLREKGVLGEIGKRIEQFCQEEGKQVKGSLFTGVDGETGRQESLIMVEVSRVPLSEQEASLLMRNAPEPPRKYSQEEISNV